MTPSPPTHVVVLTPPGRGAVAVVLVAGRDATRIVDRCFEPAGRHAVESAPIGRILLGRWGGADGEELVVCRRATDEVEVHCHGGVAAVESIVERLVSIGCRTLTWRDWLRATEDDLVRAEARIALADAPTARTAAILLDQLHGALGGAMGRALSAIECGELRRATAELDAMLAFRDLGRHLTVPWRVVLAGPPNVGKSSLINALAGFQRSIVSHVLGTTRDVVTTVTAIDGWPVELADTAGRRDSGDELESAGVALADEAAARADLVLLVGDARGTPTSLEDIRLRESTCYLHVQNKVDLLRQPTDLVGKPRLLLTSAVTGEGIVALVGAIGEALVPHAPQAGVAVPFTEQQVSALETSRAALERRDSAVGASALQALLAR
jgi:tRNA modification GTPase